MSGRGTTVDSADAPPGAGLRRILIAGRFQASMCRVLEPLSVPVGSWKESLPRAEEELSGEGVRGGCEKAWQQTKTKGTLCCRVWPRPGNGGKQRETEWT